MAETKRRRYTAEEGAQYERAYYRLQWIIDSPAPDAEEFRRELDKALAAGFPINYTDSGARRWTLLHWAVSRAAPVRAGLPQILVEAGARADAKTKYGGTPLGRACRNYVCDGRVEYLAVINILLAAGGQPESDESWKKGWTGVGWLEPEQRARCSRLEAYIASWPERRAAGRTRGRAEDAAPAFDYAL